MNDMTKSSLRTAASFIDGDVKEWISYANRLIKTYGDELQEEDQAKFNKWISDLDHISTELRNFAAEH